MTETITPDYLVVGAGAMGMAFVDTLISDTKATVALIDRYARPGGHWTIAYPFVRLHQPSAFYGVNSRPLGEGKIDQVGFNKGLSELASGDEVCAYYSTVMQQTFLPSGRVTYYAKHEYLGDGKFRSLVTNRTIRVGEHTRIVDATYMNVKVPAMVPPSYQVAEGVNLVTPNDLTKISRPFGSYTVVGAGKTGVDACLWLITNGVDPDAISWIMPRDSWFIERSTLQPGHEFAEKTAATFAAGQRAVMSASSIEDMFLRLEDLGQLMRLDQSVWPTMYRCASVSSAELEQVKRIRNIIRQGRVVSINTNKVALEQGSYEPVQDTLYVDCTADALAKQKPVPVFSGKNIVLQSVRHCQQVFSAAFIAHIETSYEDQEAKNALCRVIPHPNETTDHMITGFQSQQNGMRWAKEPKTAQWLKQARLDMFRNLLPALPKDPAEAAELWTQRVAQGDAFRAKIVELCNQLPQEHAKRVEAQLSGF